MPKKPNSQNGCLPHRQNAYVPANNAGVAELADALDSKSSGRKAVWVRAPPPAHFSKLGTDVGGSGFRRVMLLMRWIKNRKRLDFTQHE
jgi:hypothetical protein